jgi:hypothetical protein
MGSVPAGFKRHKGLTKFGNQSGLTGDTVPEQLPNGVDFWWDEAPTSDNNCWYDNVGPDGTRGSLTSDPPQNPLADTSVPGFLPENCATAIGSPIYAAKALLLLDCFAEWEQGMAGEGICNWFEMPPQPGTPKAKAEQREQRKQLEEVAESPEAKRIDEHFRKLAGNVDYGPTP